MPSPASATTAAWTCFDATAGRATGPCPGSTSQTEVSCAVWPSWRSRRGRSGRTTSGDGARTSSATPARPPPTLCWTDPLPAMPDPDVRRRFLAAGFRVHEVLEGYGYAHLLLSA